MIQKGMTTEKYKLIEHLQEQHRSVCLYGCLHEDQFRLESCSARSWGARMIEGRSLTIRRTSTVSMSMRLATQRTGATLKHVGVTEEAGRRPLQQY